MKMKNTLIAVAFIASAGFSQAAVTVTGMVDSKAAEDTTTNFTTNPETISGLSVSSGGITVTFNLTLTGNFVFNDNIETGGVDASTINSGKRTIAWSVSDATASNGEAVTFDGFTSLNAYHDIDLGYSSTFNLTTDTGTNSYTTGSNTTETTGITPTFAASSVLSVESGWPSNESGFVRINQVGVKFTVVPEPSSTALLGLGGLALILRRRK